jgi:hypothetical protein
MAKELRPPGPVAPRKEAPMADGHGRFVCRTRPVWYEHMFDTETPSIPATLDTMEPGPALAALLAALDLETVSDQDRVVVLRAHQRLASHYTGGQRGWLAYWRVGSDVTTINAFRVMSVPTTA